MPQYTFICPDGHKHDVLAKYSERDTVEDICETCGKANRYEGAPELIAHREFGKGKYGMKAILPDGSKKRVDNIYTDKKRSDS